MPSSATHHRELFSQLSDSFSSASCCRKDPLLHRHLFGWATRVTAGPPCNHQESLHAHPFGSGKRATESSGLLRRDVVPERECRPDRPKVPLCCALLESIFRNVTKDASQWGRCFCCDGGISSYALELVPFVRCELQLRAWYQVCCTLPSGLLGRMLQSYPPRDKEEGVIGPVPVARTTLLIDHIRSGIRLDLSAPISTRRDG
jgi:hypothetical protein